MKGMITLTIKEQKRNNVIFKLINKQLIII